MTTDLKPCPFQTCGGKRILIDQSISLWFAYCTNCGARGPQRQSKAGAADAWNDRVTPPAPDAAGLVRALETIKARAERRENSASFVISWTVNDCNAALAAYRAAAQPDTGTGDDEGLTVRNELKWARKNLEDANQNHSAADSTLLAIHYLCNAIAALAQERHT